MLTTESPENIQQNKSALKAGLKRMVIEICNVQDVKAEDIADDQPLIGGQGKLRLDSLDAVEIVSMLNRQFGVRLEQAGEAQKVFRSFDILSDYLIKNASSAQLAAFLK